MSAFGEPLIPLAGYALAGSPLLLVKPRSAETIASDKPTMNLSIKGWILLLVGWVQVVQQNKHLNLKFNYRILSNRTLSNNALFNKASSARMGWKTLRHDVILERKRENTVYAFCGLTTEQLTKYDDKR